MEKLISMTDYVLEQKDNYFNQRYSKIENYANFLKQSLNLGMFVPCDLDGNVLEEPLYFQEWEKGKVANKGLCDKCITYQQAQDRVIFKGFHYRTKSETITDGVNVFDEEFIFDKTIEDLIPYNLELIKEFRLFTTS